MLKEVYVFWQVNCLTHRNCDFLCGFVIKTAYEYYLLGATKHMRIGWKQYLKQRFRRASAYDSVGIAFTADQVLLCALSIADGRAVWKLDTSFSHQTWQHDLQEYVNNNGLSGAACYFALSSHWYRIHQLDQPDVEEADLFNALQWPLQEAVGGDKPVVYDYANMPVQVSGQNKVFAVAVAKEEVEKLTSVIFDADLDLRSISIEEMATTHLLKPSGEPVITLVQEHGEVVVLNIVKDQQLFFSRRLKGFENIGGFTERELEMGITDSICVQIQRSMDFFESQLRQAPVKQILVKLDSPHTAFLCDQISKAMGVQCAAFTPDIDCAKDLNFKMASFSCLGAAYTGLLESKRVSQKHNSNNVAELNKNKELVNENKH